MSRVVPVLCVLAAAGVAATGWTMLRRGAGIEVEVPAAVPAPAADDASGLAAALRAARRSCDPDALDHVLTRVRAATVASPDDADAWHLLALAHLERSLLRSHRRGMVVGAPVHPVLPPDLVADLDAGLHAAAEARRRGDDSSELFRIEAGLMSQRITGLATALQWNGRIQAALRAAAERARDNPHVHVALGLHRLLAPKLLGHDPQRALAHFEFAAKALADDERPAVFAAMASHLLQQRMQAIEWMQQAVARNPANAFARVVLQRLRAGEADPFGRDVSDAEATAAK